MKRLSEPVLWAFLVFAITFLPLWYNLAGPVIYIWDEASYANNALEMAMDKDFLVLKNNGTPSLYNVKPPLVIWLQCISIWLFGAGEWAIRFPSALAGLLTCLAVFFFTKRNFNKLTGFFAVLFLITTQGYVRHHMTRTGDLDSVLVFFITTYTLLFFELLLNENLGKQSRKRIALMGLLVFCAFMSKSVAGLMPLLGLFLGSLVIGKGMAVISSRYFYWAAFGVLLGCLSYYAIRGFAQPGYLEKVWVSEYSRFTDDIMPWLAAPWPYYFKAMYEKLYPVYIWFLPFTLLLLKNKDKKTRQLTLLGMVYCISYLLLISYPHTKLDWYLAPVYPVFSLLLASLLYVFVQSIGKFAKLEKYRWATAIPVVLLVFTWPYIQIMKQVSNVEIAEYLEREGHTLRELSQKNPTVRSFKTLMRVDYPEHVDVAGFYIKKLNHYQQYNIKLLTDKGMVAVGDTVLCSQISTVKELNELFKVDTLVSFQHGFLLRIN